MRQKINPFFHPYFIELQNNGCLQAFNRYYQAILRPINFTGTKQQLEKLTWNGIVQVVNNHENYYLYNDDKHSHTNYWGRLEKLSKILTNDSTHS